ncbi:glycoside hydrolase family 5 protein [Mycena belliarum]|uniref:glucan 1,3-beta-glucosidase n=1 Tax=Mycena belliarum TaxID=1033014 RepID=A0AAD6U1F2_9AGAR|nr:glycoside hydrolase family 5 protein [Mycena belliae]
MMHEREHDDPFISAYNPPPQTAPYSPYSDGQYPAHPYAQPLRPAVESLDSYRDDPVYPPGSANNSALLLPTSTAAPGAMSQRSYGPDYGGPYAARSSGKKKRAIGFGVVAAIIVIAAAVVLPVYFLVIKKNNASTAAAASSNNSGKNGTSTSGGKVIGAVTGGDGSTVMMTSGATFVYNNSFGGYWAADATNPFGSAGRANSWTPMLNESWNWGTDRVYGVNLGGWFVLEPFITPALFQAYPSAADEWTLSALMRADGTLQATMEKHYDTFITEHDIAQIAGAGLNWVRVPIPYWAISSWSDVGKDSTGATVAEPFLEGVCWKYVVRLLGWARKYGLRVNLDLHTIPGSQNGYNHSGKLGQVNFLNGVMGVANAQRALDYIRIITEFITQPEWADVVPQFGIMNEALMSAIGRAQLTSFYLQAHNMIRGITGVGAGHGPFISIHDGFQGVSSWAGFLPGSDRVILDTHPYFAFDQQKNDAPIATSEDAATAGGIWPAQACSAWGPSLNTSRTAFGVTVAGEFSNGYNDCGLYLTGVNGTTSFGGNCALFQDSSTWNASLKAGVQQFALASMDATQNWYFWTWKIGPALDGVVRSPLWSYQLGLESGWMPTDPRTAIGKCAARGVTGPQFSGTYSAWQTGGAGAGTIDPAAVASFGQWPPATISNVDALATSLPTYTATASIPSLTFVTPTATGSADAAVTAAPTVSVGSGWFAAQDTALAVTPVAGCTYPNAWSAVGSPVPTVCKGA